MASSPETKKIGKGMLWIFWGLLFVVLVWLFGGLLERQYNPNTRVSGSTDNQARTIKLQRNRFGHYVATGTINSKHVTFMLDTGATNVAVPEALAQTLNLKRGNAISVMTANGVARAYQTEIRTLSIGNIELKNVRAAIAPGMQNSEILLGMSALKQLDFSQSGDTLTLTQYTHDIRN